MKKTENEKERDSATDTEKEIVQKTKIERTKMKKSLQEDH